MKQVLLLVGTALAGKGTFGSLIKLIPGVGTIVGGTLQFGVATAFTYALGKAYHLHLESGGEPSGMDAEKFFASVKEFYKEGLNFAKENKEEIKKQANKKNTA
jgi:uncharacterized protein (DUF697 family)